MSSERVLDRAGGFQGDVLKLVLRHFNPYEVRDEKEYFDEIQEDHEGQPSAKAKL
jgi:hypothetical protein